MAESPLWWTVDQLISAYETGDLSPVETLELAEARIEEVDPVLNAYVSRNGAAAREQAKEAERAYRNGTAGPLAGVPISIKDAFDVKGEVATLGSLAHADDVADADSGSVRRLRESGAVLVGKTNVSEFCQSATTENLLGPPTRNPWDPSTTPGGSSGGAAASVAAGTCTLALGSDGGGSIRIPAAFCGLVGLKPATGTIEDDGRFKAFSRFLAIGPLARTVLDATRMFDVLAGGERQNSRGAALSIGWCARPEGRPVEPALLAAVAEATEALRHLGHSLEPVGLELDGWEEIFAPLVLAEEGERRGRLLDGEHALTRYVRRSLEEARRLQPEVVEEATRNLEAYRERVNCHFDTYDVLVTPGTAATAFRIGQRPDSIDGHPVSRLWGAFPFGAPFNVSGHPAIVLPVGFVDQLPVAAQLVGRYGAEAELLSLAAELEEAINLDPFGRLRSDTLIRPKS